MKGRGQIPAWGVSTLIHLALFLSLGLVTQAIPPEIIPFAIETHILDEDRPQEEIVQELDKQEVSAETMNFGPAGGAISANVGGSNSVQVQQTKIEESDSLKEPDFLVNPGTIETAGVVDFGQDLGQEEVNGETGAIVEGYGDALDAMTKELIRLMRDRKVLVVWLFDESESMKDDQQDVKSRINRVYEELNLFQNEEAKKGGRDTKDPDILQTSIVSYGETIHYHLPNKRPTSDMTKILPAIDRIPIDKTGKENTCQALMDVLRQYANLAKGRKLVVICVSDESGDDGEHIEEALAAAKKDRASLYVMGREAVFGSLYAHVVWVHPQTGGTHYLPIRRGPETPYFEQLQFEGFSRRYDAHMSGFGPYEQVRLCRNTGGIFFMLPHEQQNLNDFDARKYEALDLKQYLPNLDSRRDYEQVRSKSPFRMAIYQAAVLLNPYDPTNKELEIPTGWIPIEPAKYGTVLTQWTQRSLGTLQKLYQAQQILEGVAKLRDREASQRWRAHYDLMLGQLMIYRVRLFQYIIGLDQFGKGLPQRKLNPKSNHWAVGVSATQMLQPDKTEENFFKVKAADIDKIRTDGIAQLQKVIKLHPRTPWSKRAEWELARPMGANFAEGYIDPMPPPYKGPPIQPVPNL